MSRPSSGGFLLGFAAEIAIVVAVISLLPRIDLSGNSAAPAASAPRAFHETAHYEPSFPTGQRDAAALSPRLTFAPQPTPEQNPQRQPPPLIAVDPARPAAAVPAGPEFVERRLDRASQGLVNGLGSYVTNTADNFLRQPTPNYNSAQQYPVQPAPSYSPIAPPPAPTPLPPAAGSFATQATQPQATGPRPWVRY